jgi:hypothetical protein
MPVYSGLALIEKPYIEKNSISQFMESWLDLNDKLKPFLEESENYYIEVAKKIETLSRELEKINRQLLMQIRK